MVNEIERAPASSQGSDLLDGGTINSALKSSLGGRRQGVEGDNEFRFDCSSLRSPQDSSEHNVQG